MRFFYFILFSGFCLVTNAQSQMLEFNTKMIDLGIIEKGSVHELKFEFVNTSNEPIEIDFVSTCECTEADWSYGEIPPGASGYINAVFDSNKKKETEEIELAVQLINSDKNTGAPLVEYLFYKYSYK